MFHSLYSFMSILLGSSLPGDTPITIPLLQDHFRARGYTLPEDHIKAQLDKQLITTLGNMRLGIVNEKIWTATTLPELARQALMNAFCQQSIGLVSYFLPPYFVLCNSLHIYILLSSYIYLLSPLFRSL